MDKHDVNAKGPSKEFTPPRHWVGLEELDEQYWNDSKIQEKRGQEFYEKPVEWLDMMDKTGKTGMARRDFLTIMGASMAMASFSCARRPVHKIIPYVVKPEEIVPGQASFYASTCQECSVGCGVLIKNREGRPIKLEGNPDHPMNRGALCSRGQASLLNLYDQDRLTAPVTGSRSGAHQQIVWADADAAILAKLKGARSVRVLTGEVRGESTQRLISEFLGSVGNGAHVVYEPLAEEELVESQKLSYGEAVAPHYHFDKADLIVSLGADFLSNWLSPVEYSGQWAKNRKLNSKNAANAKLSKMVCFEPSMTVTGSNADERYPIRSGDELKIALALAHEIIVAQKESSYAGDSAVAQALQGYSVKAVAEETGVDAAKLKELAHELSKARGKSLVVAGSAQSRTADALALQVAANLLNSALENDGVTVDGTAATGMVQSRFAKAAKLIQEMKSGQVDVLIVSGTNPAFTLPASLGFAEAAKKVPLVISIADREDETARLADYVLADHHYLENWGDASPRKGLYSLQQPAVAPIHNTRSFQDTLLVWTKGLGKATGLAVRAADWHGYLQGNWQERIYPQARAAGTFVQFWEGVLRAGVFASAQSGRASKRSFRSASLSVLPKFKKTEGMTLALYASNALYDGRSANNPWLQELPDPITAITWDNYLSIAPATAKKLGFQENDIVEVKSGEVVAELPVHVQPGMHASSVSAALGYGRRSVGKIGNLAGVDLYPFVQMNGDALSYSGRSVSLRKTGRVYRLASTQWHTATENRPVINDITLAEFKKNPATANHTDPHLRLDEVPTMWPKFEYKGYRWGMAIDLNSCTGCAACVISCQAENNIPVVGREQVRASRAMHWIRIDRYYSGTAENPDVIFQPMLCQHCENAPCETVCPVLATVHDDEGLNAQVYNRCVGTRYCQNNCPYKVRRFNFFDHWKSYEGTMNLVWNPDVTVRTRGIMEKCTFCVQRIRDAKEKAKDDGVKVKDGDFQTACQQTCPTNAIVFGDINDPNSTVSKLRAEQRAFRSLEVLNTAPVISYLTKVRNKEAAPHNGGAHHS